MKDTNSTKDATKKSASMLTQTIDYWKGISSLQRDTKSIMDDIVTVMSDLCADLGVENPLLSASTTLCLKKKEDPTSSILYPKQKEEGKGESATADRTLNATIDYLGQCSLNNSLEAKAALAEVLTFLEELKKSLVE